MSERTENVKKQFLSFWMFYKLSGLEVFSIRTYFGSETPLSQMR